MFSAVRPTANMGRRHVARHASGPVIVIMGRLLTQTTDCRVAHVVGPSDVGQHLSRLPASDRFPFLMVGKLRFPTKDYPPRLRTLPPLAGPRSDQFALELGETAQYGQHQRPWAVVVSAQVSLNDLN